MYKNLLGKFLTFFCAFILLTVSLAVGIPASASELPHNCYPLSPNTDRDDMPDGYEVRYDLNPLKKDANDDYDKDGLNNSQEYTYNIPPGWTFSTHGIWWNGTNPRKWDTDGDGIGDSAEITNWYTYEKIEAEYYFDNSVVFSDNYFINSDNSAIHLEDKSMTIPIEVRWDGSYRFSVYARSNDGATLTLKVDGVQIGGVWSVPMDWALYSYGAKELVVKSDSVILLTATKTTQIDYILIEKQGLDPLNPDVDGDGLYDGYDIRDAYGNLIKGEKSYNCYPLSPDTDRDGMPDGEEVRNNLNPNPEHDLKIPTLLMLPENGGAIYSSMLEQVDLYIFIMTISGSIPDCPKDRYGSDLLVQGVQEIIVPYNVIYQLKSINTADPNSIPYVPVDANCYQTRVNVMINGTNHKTNLTVFTFTLNGSGASSLLSALLCYSSASRITHEVGYHLPDAVVEITPCIVENPDKKGSWWDSACSVGETIVGGVKSGAKAVVNAAINTGKAIINTAQDGLKYLEKIGKTILDAYVAVWNQLVEWGSQIVSAIMAAINWFIDWILSAVEEMITNALEGLTSGIQSLINNLDNALSESFEEYKNTGSISDSTMKKVVEALSYLLLIPAIIATVIIVIGLIVAPFISAFTFLLGTVISLIAPLIVSAIAPEISMGGGIDWLTGGALCDVGQSLKDHYETVGNVDVWEWVLAIGSLLAAGFSAALVDPTRTTAAIVGFGLAVFAAIYAFAVSPLISYNAGAAVFFAGVGAFLSFVGTFGATSGGVIVGGVGLILGITGVCYAAHKAGWI